MIKLKQAVQNWQTHGLIIQVELLFGASMEASTVDITQELGYLCYVVFFQKLYKVNRNDEDCLYFPTSTTLNYLVSICGAVDRCPTRSLYRFGKDHLIQFRTFKP